MKEKAIVNGIVGPECSVFVEAGTTTPLESEKQLGVYAHGALLLQRKKLHQEWVMRDMVNVAIEFWHDRFARVDGTPPRRRKEATDLKSLW